MNINKLYIKKKLLFIILYLIIIFLIIIYLILYI